MDKLNTSKSLKKKFLILTIAFGFVTIGLKAQRADFSGIWIRNTDKCVTDAHLSINSIPIEFLIKQDNAHIEIGSISKNYMGDTTKYVEKLKFDGSPSTFIIKSNLKKKASMQWALDQKGFMETATYANDQGDTLQSAKALWTFAPDLKTLKIQWIVTVNGQNYEAIEVFDKK